MKLTARGAKNFSKSPQTFKMYVGFLSVCTKETKRDLIENFYFCIFKPTPCVNRLVYWKVSLSIIQMHHIDKPRERVIFLE